MLELSPETLTGACFDPVNGHEPALKVGEYVRHVLGGPEMLIIGRTAEGPYEYALTRYRNPNTTEDAHNTFFCGNLRRLSASSISNN